jgi:prevent-host-death family protein
MPQLSHQLSAINPQRRPTIAMCLETPLCKGYSSHMKRASVTEAKNNFSALIDSVKEGSPVLIVDRGRPVARLEPVGGAASDDDGRLARLVRDGIVRPARGGPLKAVLAHKPPRPKKGASGVRALLDDRRTGR